MRSSVKESEAISLKSLQLASFKMSHILTSFSNSFANLRQEPKLEINCSSFLLLAYSQRFYRDYQSRLVNLSRNNPGLAYEFTSPDLVAYF